MSDALRKIDTAVRALTEAGARRNPESGQWITRDGLALDGDPLRAVRALRRERVKQAVEAKRERGESFTR